MTFRDFVVYETERHLKIAASADTAEAFRAFVEKESRCSNDSTPPSRARRPRPRRCACRPQQGARSRGGVQRPRRGRLRSSQRGAASRHAVHRGRVAHDGGDGGRSAIAAHGGRRRVHGDQPHRRPVAIPGAAEALGIRTALEADDHGYKIWQLHPGDTGGSFLEIDFQPGGDDPQGPWCPPVPIGSALSARRSLTASPVSNSRSRTPTRRRPDGTRSSASRTSTTPRSTGRGDGRSRRGRCAGIRNRHPPHLRGRLPLLNRKERACCRKPKSSRASKTNSKASPPSCARSTNATGPAPADAKGGQSAT